MPSASTLVRWRLYRVGLVLAVPFLLLALLTGRTPARIDSPDLPLTFDGATARHQAATLTRLAPDRSPGTGGAERAADYVESRFAAAGMSTSRQRFTVDTGGGRRVAEQNVIGIVAPPGMPPLGADQPQEAIVVTARRDVEPPGPGADDNASGTAVLVELGRALVGTVSGRPVVLASLDGGTTGDAGARYLAEHPPAGIDPVAVLGLRAVGRGGAVRLRLAGDDSRRPAAGLVRGVSTALRAQGVPVELPSVGSQALALLVPSGSGDQAPFVAHGVPALTVDGGQSTLNPAADTVSGLHARRIEQVGLAAEATVLALGSGPTLHNPPRSYVAVGDRGFGGWAIQLLLASLLVAPAIVVFDLAGRARRRGIPLAPAGWAVAERALPFALAALVLRLEGVLGFVPDRLDPPFPGEGVGVGWGVLVLPLVVAAAAWLLLHGRRTRIGGDPAEAGLAAFCAALAAAGMGAVLMLVANPYLLILALPALHVWLVLPSLWRLGVMARLGAVALGLLGPAALLALLAGPGRYGTDAPAMAVRLLGDGTIGLAAAVGGALLLAAGLQLAAVVVGRSLGESPWTAPRRAVR